MTKPLTFTVTLDVEIREPSELQLAYRLEAAIKSALDKELPKSIDGVSVYYTP